MALIMFSSLGVHYESGEGGAVTALFVPNKDQIRQFADLEGNNVKEIAERYGTHGNKPLWRLERGQVVVYGSLPDVLAEKRQEVNVFLPQQLLPASCDVFFFILEDKWIIHGVKVTNDEGKVVWAVSKIDMNEKDVEETVINTVSERMLNGVGEEYCIAVTNNDAVLQKLKEGLEPYGLEATRFETLKPGRGEQPIYRHRNYSLLMMTFAILALLSVVVTGGYWLVNRTELESKRQEIRDVQRRIDEIELNKQIGHIRNPQQILERMRQDLNQAPSAILNAAAQLGARFGKVNNVTMELADERGNGQEMYDPETGEKGREVAVKLQVKDLTNTLLVDQESLAKSLMAEAPWVRDIKNYSRAENVGQVKEGLFEMTLRVE